MVPEDRGRRPRPPEKAQNRPDGSAERVALAFARVLRGMGLNVPVESVAVFVKALALLGMGQRRGVYWALRTSLVSRQEDLAAYDRAFDASGMVD